MKKSFQKPVKRGKHCINLYVDFDHEDAGCFVTGHYDVHVYIVVTCNETSSILVIEIHIEVDTVFASLHWFLK